ncbi:hypothetical protein [Xenorhabdus sp. IM139775]|uniref:hypothetical protein n=1 Tax=Xenorhabdus sp. IM139775 TaxID=3025876 RepID=UPI00235A31A3|nr:hypothetical protein [Xenorhabdus sp. IM139775]MDC9592492.1 hypothetical protein [Xenorhabdus sp. IM139775]
MGQYRHTISNIMAMTDDEVIQKTTEVNFHQEKRFHYFLDKPKHKVGYRLNIVGHTSPVGQEILFVGSCQYNPGMNLNDFCETIKALLTDIKNRGQNIQSVRIVACHSGTNGLAQALANHINMPVKGSLGGTRICLTTEYRPMSNISRYFIDKGGDRSHSSQEERDRQERHDPHYGMYRWYNPQIQSLDSDSEFGEFVNQLAQRPQPSDSGREFDEFVNQRVQRLQRSDSGREFDEFVNQRTQRLQRSDSSREFDVFVSQRIPRKNCR